MKLVMNIVIEGILIIVNCILKFLCILQLVILDRHTHGGGESRSHTHTRMHTQTYTHTAKPKKSTDKPSCLFESLHFFISKLSLHGLEAAVHYVQQGCNSIHTPKEIEEYNRAKCAVIVKVMKFATVLLDKHPGEAFTVSVSLPFSILLSIFVMVV